MSRKAQTPRRKCYGLSTYFLPTFYLLSTTK
jgi:hypothetical protein